MGTVYAKIGIVVALAWANTALGEETLIECSKIEDPTDRVACYDKLAGRVEKKLEGGFSGTTEQRVEAMNQSISEEVVGGAAKVPEILSVEIQSVLRDRNRRVTYVTTDGRYFKRSSDAKTTFEVGDKLVIEEGMMSSKFLVRGDGRKNKVSEVN